MFVTQNMSEFAEPRRCQRYSAPNVRNLVAVRLKNRPEVLEPPTILVSPPYAVLLYLSAFPVLCLSFNLGHDSMLVFVVPQTRGENFRHSNMTKITGANG